MPNTAILGHNDVGEWNGITVDDCRQKCSTVESCKSFDYNKKNFKCMLSTKNREDNGVVLGTNDHADQNIANIQDWALWDYYEKKQGTVVVL